MLRKDCLVEHMADQTEMDIEYWCIDANHILPFAKHPAHLLNHRKSHHNQVHKMYHLIHKYFRNSENAISHLASVCGQMHYGLQECPCTLMQEYNMPFPALYFHAEHSDFHSVAVLSSQSPPILSLAATLLLRCLQRGTAVFHYNGVFFAALCCK